MKPLNIAKTTEFSTVEETAKELGINSQTVRDYLAKGQLTTYKFKTLTLVSKEEIRQWKNERSKK